MLERRIHSAPRLAGERIAAARRPGDQRRRDERDGERQQRRQGLQTGPHEAGGGQERHAARKAHGAEPHRIDVVEMGALELDAGRTEPERLVDRKVGHDGAEPGHRHDGEEAEDPLQRLINAEFHQQQRDGDVEHEPDHPARMAMGQPREKIRPGERARIGVHDVDLELRHDHEGGCEQRHRLGPGQHVAEGDAVHLRRLGPRVSGSTPARSASTASSEPNSSLGAPSTIQPGPAASRAIIHPRRFWRGLAGRKRSMSTCSPICGIRARITEAGAAELQQVEGGAPCHGGRSEARETRPVQDGRPVPPQDEAHRQQVEADPQRLRQQLETADPGDAIGDEGDDRDCAQHIGEPDRHAEEQVERRRHDRAFDGEQNEGEGRIDERRHGRADVAEAGAPGQQVDVDPVAGRIDGDRQPGEEQDDSHDQRGGEHVGEPVGERDGAPDRLEGQERDGADRGLRHPRRRPAPGALGGEAQREILERLVRDPAIVVAPYGQDALAAGHEVSSKERRVPILCGATRSG